MTNAGTRSVPAPVAASTRTQSRLGLAIVGSVVMGVALAVIGLRMALHAQVVPCPDGTYFPQGTTDSRCFSHPHAGEGVGLVLVAAMLTVLILLVVWQLRIALGIAVAKPQDATAIATGAPSEG